jgi:hypothetical protein
LAALDCIERARPFGYTQPKRETTEEKINRGAARRLLAKEVAKALMAPRGEALAKQTLGVKMWRKLAYFWAQAGKLDSSERDLLFTLHAMAEGESYLEFYYKDLYKLLYPFDGSESDSAINQRVRRRFEQLAEAEDKCGVPFLTLRPGKKVDDENVPSSVQLLSIGYVEQIEDIAEVDPYFSRGKRAAFERAAQKFIEFKAGTPFKRSFAPAKNIYRQIEDGRKRAEGNLRKTLERMQKENYLDWAIAQELVKALKNSIPPKLLESTEFKETLRVELLEDSTSQVKGNHDLKNLSPGGVESAENQTGEGIKSETSKSPQPPANPTDAHAGFQKTCKDFAGNLHDERAETGANLSTDELFDQVDDEIGGFTR